MKLLMMAEKCERILCLMFIGRILYVVVSDRFAPFFHSCNRKTEGISLLLKMEKSNSCGWNYFLALDFMIRNLKEK